MCYTDTIHKDEGADASTAVSRGCKHGENVANIYTQISIGHYARTVIVRQMGQAVH